MTPARNREVVRELMDCIEVVTITEIAIPPDQCGRNSRFAGSKLPVAIGGHAVLTDSERVEIEVGVGARIGEYVVGFVDAVTELVQHRGGEDVNMLNGDIVSARQCGGGEVGIEHQV